VSGPTAEGWERLFAELPLRQELAATGWATLTAEQIKAVSRREPRLMTKFDTRESRPPQLADLTILPLTNGSYALVEGDGYAEVPSATRTQFWVPPAIQAGVLTLPWRLGPSSESQALDMATATGLLQHFLGESEMRLTIRGRLRAPRFGFIFAGKSAEVPLTADGVQVEVDSGFEGDGIHLIEAKLGTRSNFHIRQLYYPMRMWSDLVPTKTVTTVFLSWSNRCFSLRSFRFDPVQSYHAIQPVASVDYILDEPAGTPDLPHILGMTSQDGMPHEVPFPQADDPRRVIDIVDAVASSIVTRPEIAARFEFDERQADYYANAAVFLGLLVRTPQHAFSLSDVGADFVGAEQVVRHRIFLRMMARRGVFRQALEVVCQRQELPSAAEVADLIAKFTGLTGSTPARRARTVLSWTRWAARVAEIPLANSTTPLF